MSSRANFVWKENNKINIYYAGGNAAKEAPELLLKGLEICKNHFSKYEIDEYLMDNAFADGSIMIDIDAKHIIVFGGEDASWCPVLKRHYLKRYRKLYPEFIIEWAYAGNSDIAEYLGLMQDYILNGVDRSDYILRTEMLEWPSESHFTVIEDHLECVLTIIKNGEIKDYALYAGIKNAISCYENVINLVSEKQLIKKWKKESSTQETLLVDYDNKKLFVCWGRRTHRLQVEAVQRFWQVWEVIHHHDGVIFHFTYSNRDKKRIELTDEEFEKYPLFEEYTN